MSVGYRTHAEPTVIRRAAEMWPEGVEEIPYASSFTPPFPFPGLPMVAGGGSGSGSGSGSASSTGSSTTQDPASYDLAWTAGDWFEAEFFFDNVAWTPEDPFVDIGPDPGPAFQSPWRYTAVTTGGGTYPGDGKVGVASWGAPTSFIEIAGKDYNAQVHDLSFPPGGQWVFYALGNEVARYHMDTTGTIGASSGGNNWWYFTARLTSSPTAAPGEGTVLQVSYIPPPVTVSAPAGIEWERHDWCAQVRTQYPTNAGYWWPPVVPYGVLLTEFGVAATWQDDFQGNGPGTLVRIYGGASFPGTYVWDLQSTAFPHAPDDLSVWHPRTWLQGKVTIGKQVTVPGTYNWGDTGAGWPSDTNQWVRAPGYYP